MSSIHPDTTMGKVALTVANLDRSLAYYQEIIGLSLHQRAEGTAVLGVGKRALLILEEVPNGRFVPQTAGLYHFALLLPSRPALAHTLSHLLATGIPISGFADHAVSEAIYLTDPDGHGIEIYRDRPRHEWEYVNGQLKITVEPFDAASVLAAGGDSKPAWTGLHPQTVMGHVHLRVTDVRLAEQFYVETLGFELIARYGAEASFVGAGGYHHHLGMNAWGGVVAPPADAWQLQWYEIDIVDLEVMKQRLQTAAVPFRQQENTLYVTDPSGNHIRLTAKN